MKNNMFRFLYIQKNNNVIKYKVIPIYKFN